MARVTMKDIAKQAGITQQAVSLIINHKASMVSQATKQKVWRLVRELNYTPNYVAQSLRSGKRFCVGVAGTGSLEEMDDLTISRIYSGIGAVVQEFHHNLMFIPMGQDNLLEMLVRTAQSGMVDGLIIMVYSSSIYRFRETIGVELEDRKIPYVAIHSTATDLGCFNVGFDARAAGRLAGEHLAARGYASVGELGPEDREYASQLHEGFTDALNAAGITDAEHEVTDHAYNTGLGEEFARRALADGTLKRAYFCHSDAYAYGMIHALRQAGKRVPEDVAVMSVDDMMTTRHMPLDLTAVSRRFKERGTAAARMLFGLMDGSLKADKPKCVILEPELKVRATT